MQKESENITEYKKINHFIKSEEKEKLINSNATFKMNFLVIDFFNTTKRLFPNKIKIVAVTEEFILLKPKNHRTLIIPRKNHKRFTINYCGETKKYSIKYFS